MFDTKIAVVLLDSLEVWQKLNVTSFLTSGIIGEAPSLIGQEYRDKSDYTYLELLRQPVIILECNEETLKRVHARICGKSIKCSIYISDMFSTDNDDANRETVLRYKTDELPLVGIALREEKKIVDKVTKGAKLHT